MCAPCATAESHFALGWRSHAGAGRVGSMQSFLSSFASTVLDAAATLVADENDNQIEAATVSPTELEFAEVRRAGTFATCTRSRAPLVLVWTSESSISRPLSHALRLVRPESNVG